MKKIKLSSSITLLGLLIILDMWSVDKRYLNNDHFVTPREFTNNFNLRPVDKEILKDTDIHYRVLDLAVKYILTTHIPVFIIKQSEDIVLLNYSVIRI